MNYKRNILIGVSSSIGALLLIHLVGGIVVDLGGIEFAAKITLSRRGYTALALPPLGMLRASTHSIPLGINIVLQNVNLDFLKMVIDGSADKDELLLLLRDDIYRAMWLLSIKLMSVSMIGAVIAGIIFKAKKREMLIACIVGLIIPVLMLSSLFLTYNMTAFNTPEFTGALEAAPWIIGMFTNGLDQINQFGQHLKVISGNISQVFAKMDDIKSLDGDFTTRVLHVSDIHNNPAAIDFMDQIVKSFNVDFIIDTGDITDYGTPFEDALINKISELPVPYVFVAGNHDSINTVKLLKSTRNVYVLDDSTAVLSGINILGFADPNSKTEYIKTPDVTEIMEHSSYIHERLDNFKPDILVVHNPDTSKELLGKVPVILNGHNHKLSFSQRDGTNIINAGTTGAAGIRGLQSRNDIPYTAVLLYFDKSNEDGRPALIALDLIKISSIKAGFEIQRAFFDREALP